MTGIGKVSEPVNVGLIFVTTPDKYTIKAGENLIYRALATDANAGVCRDNGAPESAGSSKIMFWVIPLRYRIPTYQYFDK